MLNKLFFVPILSLTIWHSSAQAVPQNQLDAISSMGQLNAVALQCQYISQMQNIKRVLIKVLPQKRELGEWFEHTTNEAYMSFLSDNKSCPSESQFKLQLQQSFKALEAAF